MSHMAVAHNSQVPSWFHRSWWVVGFILLCSMIYLHALRQKDRSYQELTHQFEALEQEKIAALAQQEELLLQIDSQSDPAWVEMVLKRNLGLVPEGQVKVYFQQE